MREIITAAIAGVDDWRGVTDPSILADAIVEAMIQDGAERWKNHPDNKPLLVGDDTTGDVSRE